MRNILFIISCFCCIQASSQNLYDEKRSKEFVNYLMHSGQYSLAAIETERLLFLEPANDSLRETLISCYTLNKEFAVANKRILMFYPDIQSIKKPFDNYFAYTLLADKKTQLTRDFIASSPTFETDKKQYYQAFSYLIDHDYKHSEAYLSGLTSNEKSIMIAKEFSKEGSMQKRKSPGLALAMSAIVPGTGKFYTHDYIDGIFSMLSIGVTGYQAIRGFQEKGTKSAYGWIYATVATGFYLGNVYGAFSSAKRYNKRQTDKLDQKVNAAFNLHP